MTLNVALYASGASQIPTQDAFETEKCLRIGRVMPRNIWTAIDSGCHPATRAVASAQAARTGDDKNLANEAPPALRAFG